VCAETCESSADRPPPPKQADISNRLRVSALAPLNGHDPSGACRRRLYARAHLRGAKASLIGMIVGPAERPPGWRPSSLAGITTSSSGSLAMLVATRRASSPMSKHVAYVN
jgi:hypothetical protein